MYDCVRKLSVPRGCFARSNVGGFFINIMSTSCLLDLPKNVDVYKHNKPVGYNVIDYRSR